MKKFLLLGVALFVLCAAQAQKVYFIYLQSDNSSPFYLKMGDKISSSTAEGYLILPKLVDSTYTFFIGRPAKSSSETKFAVAVDKRDHGLLLKEMDGVLNLFDMQTMELIKPLENVAEMETALERGVRRTDAFTLLLAKAADDSSLLYMPVAAKKADKPKQAKSPVITPAVVTESVAMVVDTPAIVNSNPVAITEAKPKEDTVAVVAEPVTTTSEPVTIAKDSTVRQEVAIVQQDSLRQALEKVVEPAAEEKEPKEVVEEYKRSVVTRYSESSTSAGFGLVFLDHADGAIDTIRILIPNPTNIFKTGERDTIADKKKFLDISNSVVEKAPDTNVVAVDVVSNTQADTVNNNAVEKPVVTAPVTVPQQGKIANCKNMAMESDFKKLRKYMAAKENDRDMIAEAKKAFQTKCFSTDQVKNLSALFLTDESKFKFFETAYSYIIDPFQFATLQQELKEEKYINQFKTLTGN